MSEDNIKPFSKSYVLRITARHMRKDIDMSIRKTFERIKDFDGNPEKSLEVFETLSTLHAMRRNLDEFQAANKAAFKE